MSEGPSVYERALLRLIAQSGYMPRWIDLSGLEAKGWIVESRNGAMLTARGRAVLKPVEDDDPEYGPPSRS